MIKANDVETVVQEGEVIEDYPEDERGHRCLLFGFDAQKRPLHVVCSPKEDYLAIITIYLPHPAALKKEKGDESSGSREACHFRRTLTNLD